MKNTNDPVTTLRILADAIERERQSRKRTRTFVATKGRRLFFLHGKVDAHSHEKFYGVHYTNPLRDIATGPFNSPEEALAFRLYIMKFKFDPEQIGGWLIKEEPEE